MLLSLIYILSLILANFTYTSEKIKILDTSIQKSGTHLVDKCIGLMYPEYKKAPIHGEMVLMLKKFFKDPENHAFLGSHIPYIPEIVKLIESNNCKCILNYRDPRDQIVALAHWLHKDPRINFMQYLDFDDLLEELILCAFNSRTCNREIGTELYNHYLPWESYLKWKDHPKFYVVRFEDLVGPKGGGTLEAQIRTIKELEKHIGVKISGNPEEIANKLFGGTASFRQGQIGSWRKYFNERHVKIFKEVAGQLLIDLKYEPDLNWSINN